MTRSLARRGPDAEGLHQWPCAVFGHRRLSIFDLSDAGRQPMLSADGQVGVVFNGAIYNFLDLRRDLEARGHRFHSQCDTEVLVEGYLEWGVDGLVQRLRGMFAFAVWDNRRATLFLVRDRLGVKPLLFSAAHGRLSFASTLPALVASGVAGDLDPVAVLEFLEYGFVTDGRAILAGVQKVPAGSIVEWHGGELGSRPYWSLPRVNPTLRISFREAVEQTEQLLLESVRLRLFADVPLGVLLSGGIDSSLVCWAVTKLNADLKAFTVSTPGDPCDESGQARDTARLLGIPHEIVPLSSAEPPSISELISAYGEPFACSSALAMLKVSRAVKSKLTVLLTGDGGDDVFLGYPFHRHFWMAQRLAGALPRPLASLWPRLRPLADTCGALRRPKHFLDYATGGLGAATRVHDGLPYYRSRCMLGDRLAALTFAPRAIPLSLESARRLLPDILDHEQRTTFVGEYTTKVDGATMHYALEARSPLLDQSLWEFAAALPFSLRLHRGRLKAILREIVRRNISPQLAALKKSGFTIPVERWFAAQWKEDLQDSLQHSLLVQQGWIHPAGLAESLREARCGDCVPTQLWRLFVLENWLRRS